jgi:hypothetical protein
LPTPPGHSDTVAQDRADGGDFRLAPEEGGWQRGERRAVGAGCWDGGALLRRAHEGVARRAGQPEGVGQGRDGVGVGALAAPALERGDALGGQARASGEVFLGQSGGLAALAQLRAE